MTWSEQIFAYCERGADPSFWAEPFNALSNALYIIAAVIAAVAARRARVTDVIAWSLVALTFVIGIGSFLFHTYATRWSALADSAPIALFMFGYVAFASRRFLALSWLATVAGLAVFFGAMAAMRWVPCGETLLPITAAAGRPCFNGSLSYVPAAATLMLIGGILATRRHPAAAAIALAAALFAASLFLRTLDFEVCALTDVLGRPRGTHALWHILNAAVLLTLLIAALRDAAPSSTNAQLQRAA